jgi:hypothetical protein
MRRIRAMAGAAAIVAALLQSGGAEAEEPPPLTVTRLLADGWKVAGYTASGTTYILFTHENADHVVQCSVLYDTTRGTKPSERVRTNCYEVR